MNKLFFGDNLEILNTLPTESVDLVYIDPPIFSNGKYEPLWKDSYEMQSFIPFLNKGIEGYISWLKPRIIELHRVLKKTGSIFLHCNWKVESQIKIYLLDQIFGENNFINRINWKSDLEKQSRGKSFVQVSDTIFFYAKDFQKYKFQNIQEFNDFWDDCDFEGKKDKKKYSTQKPLLLLERIIKSASNAGDTVLDCFVGGGTTIKVADRLNREWIGIDESSNAINYCSKQMKTCQNGYEMKISRSIEKLNEKSKEALKPLKTISPASEIKFLVDGYKPIIEKLGSNAMIYDILREKYVKYTNEEKVRQMFLHFLVENLGYPKALIKVEQQFFDNNKNKKKADILVYGKTRTNFMVVECKADTIDLSQKVFNQVKEYNQTLNAKYIVVVNGLFYGIRTFDEEKKYYKIVKEMPIFE